MTIKSFYEKLSYLTFTTLWAFSADRKLIFFLFFPENRIWHFMQIVSSGDNLHAMSNPVFWENKKNISKCRLLKFLPRVLSVKVMPQQSIPHLLPITIEMLYSRFNWKFLNLMQHSWILQVLPSWSEINFWHDTLYHLYHVEIWDTSQKPIQALYCLVYHFYSQFPRNSMQAALFKFTNFFFFFFWFVELKWLLINLSLIQFDFWWLMAQWSFFLKYCLTSLTYLDLGTSSLDLITFRLLFFFHTSPSAPASLIQRGGLCSCPFLMPILFRLPRFQI